MYKGQEFKAILHAEFEASVHLVGTPFPPWEVWGSAAGGKEVSLDSEVLL